jgi:hypothetical protein
VQEKAVVPGSSHDYRPGLTGPLAGFQQINRLGFFGQTAANPQAEIQDYLIFDQPAALVVGDFAFAQEQQIVHRLG